MTPEPISPDQRRGLQSVRDKLLELHKMLLDRERSAYEREYGPILSAGAFLQLVLNHPHFEWLRQLSSLVVNIDEVLAPRSAAGAADIGPLFEQTRALLVPSEDGSDFQRRYWQAVQESVDVLFAHRAITGLLTPC